MKIVQDYPISGYILCFCTIDTDKLPW